MQFNLFNKAATNVKSYFARAEYFDWRKYLQEKSYRAQTQLFDNNFEVQRYSSGASNISDLKGYMGAFKNVCVCILDTSSKVKCLLSEYASNGGKVLIDSGAFRVFNNPKLGLSFTKVLDDYISIAKNCNAPENLIFVAPDVIGNQDESFKQLSYYVDELVLLELLGAKVMVPHQVGSLLLSEYYYKCQDLLGFDFIVGLPSNAAALSSDDLKPFLRDTKPAHIHFLGVSDSFLIHQANEWSENTIISCDATTIRKYLGKNALLTEMHKEIVGDVILSSSLGHTLAEYGIHGQYDSTEIIGDLEFIVSNFSITELKRFSDFINCNLSQIKNADGHDELWRLIDENNHGYGVEVVQQFFEEQCRKEVSAKVRTSCIRELALRELI